MNKINAIVKTPDEPIGHLEQVSDTLKSYQTLVDGYIETLHIPQRRGLILICNEEGKLRNLEPNITLAWNSTIFDVIRGTIVLVGAAGEHFTDCPLSLDEWQALMKEWGN